MNRLLTGMINEQHILQQSVAMDGWMDGWMDAYIHGTLMASPTSGTDRGLKHAHAVRFVNVIVTISTINSGNIDYSRNDSPRIIYLGRAFVRIRNICAHLCESERRKLGIKESNRIICTNRNDASALCIRKVYKR
ncbi:hypothetical protein T07_14123 [Trichinella nelsoni]|uniref:Uncharacterized protein n=1 Tax=Trichinella nelsoni TaxID=6336 RepID=A0A0V0S0R9_9BILA|nr:hypothetical protein T07_14123 [Trichinella nelsoni]